jgi:dsRNA-specific ribonuclease
MDEELGQGEGNSKKEAEIEAARMALSQRLWEDLESD